MLQNADVSLTDQDVFEMAEAHTNSALLHFSHKAGLFDFIENPKTVESVSKHFGWVHRKTGVILNALVALKLASKNGDAFEAAPVVKNRLLKSSKNYFGSYLELRRIQWNLWGNLAQVLATEAHVDGQQRLDETSDLEFSKLFQDAMAQVCGGNIHGLTDLKIWKPSDHVIDLGGGHGVHVCELLTKFPDMSGEVLDLAAARNSAEENFRKFKLNGRAKFRECNLTGEFLSLEFACNVIMINHCLHHFNPDDAERILRKSITALMNGGTLVLIDQILLESGNIPPNSALFSFYLMVSNQTGQLHPLPWITRILEESGCSISVGRCSWNDEDFILTATK